MKIVKTSNYNDSQYGDDKQLPKDVDRDLIKIFDCLNGRIRLGSGTTGSSGENLAGAWVKVLTSGTSGTEVGVAHRVGSQPMGYLVVTQDKAGSIYAEPNGLGINTVWTSGTAYFKSNAVNANFLVFLLERGGQ